MLVGIPRALTYFEFQPLWEHWLRRLGYMPVVSPPTNKAMLDDGIEVAPEEACLPLKAYLGHVKLLSAQVDNVFVPRVVRWAKLRHSCPKIIALPDIVKSVFPDIPLTPEYIVDASPLAVRSAAAAVKWGTSSCGSLLQSISAYWKALAEWKRNHFAAGETTVSRGRPRVAIVGHRYLTGDPFLSGHIESALRAMGAAVLCLPPLPLAGCDWELCGKRVYWHHEARLVREVLHYLSGAADGVVHLSCFGCGPDSMIADLLAEWAKRNSRVPFITLTVDEHSGDAGFVTRLEAFMDMVEAATSENNVSTHR